MFWAWSPTRSRYFCEHKRLDEVRRNPAFTLNAAHHIGLHAFEKRIDLRIFPNRRTRAVRRRVPTNASSSIMQIMQARSPISRRCAESSSSSVLAG